jgi:HSP20 family protein
MSMMHFEPFRSLHDLDRFTSQLLSGTQVPHAMPMDVWREGQTYHVALDLPGVDTDAIDIHVERNTLTISAARQPAFRATGGGGNADAGGEPGQSQVLVAERPQGSFTRQLVLGEGLDTSAVEADYSNGVLHLTIPVHQAAQPRRISVGVTKNEGGQPRVIEGDPQSGAAGDSGADQGG